MGKKVYAIKEGFDSEANMKIENKIVDTWAECLKYVKGVKGAKYKSFEDINEAKRFLEEGSKLLKMGVDEYPKDCLHIYVDGSYNISTQKYSYGLVAVRNNVVEYIDSASAVDTSKSNIRQIAGELEAAVKGVEYALSRDDKKVVIIHDYEGIAHHATGFWERREESSIRYFNRMNELMKLGIEVIFVKVDSHTGEFFNELADEKCKEKLAIDSDRVVDKWLANNILYVSNEKVRDEVISITNNKEENIVVVGNQKNSSSESKKDGVERDIPEEINRILIKLSKEKQLRVLEVIKEISAE
ncbi:ribonuclease H1 domain-containing protein [Clostridium sp. 'White wine YQ']|uniref:ribonuclease H1 domain-containing protein n=1 Tax=Clostridium sp. 'White wine YQ' TaxID=3027474 RepID=UPI002365386C|nr:viroplasmin family protein [Clostridium sp. 'White wine YQ']MDD7792936.1 viroplasmin family protein [Clostridium sp. 'White wine YQ']